MDDGSAITHRKDYGHLWSDQKALSDQVSMVTNTTGESMTVQSQAEDADINVLMRKYGITGKMPENPRVPMYGDFSHITDYRSAIEAVRAADIAFMEIPAEKRAKFDNDPQKLLEFVYNEANAAAVQEMFGERVVSVTGQAVGAAGAASAGVAQGNSGSPGGSQGASGSAA